MDVNESKIPKANRFTAVSFFLCLIGLFISPPVVAWGVSGRDVFEKTLTGMAQPLFVLVASLVSLSIATMVSGRFKLGMGLFVICSVLWVSSTGVFVGPLVKSLEGQVQSVVPTRNEPLDVLVVLGGGTGKRPDGGAQLGSSGDRVGFAARLYLTGCVKFLVTTGDPLPIYGTLVGVNEQSGDPSDDTRTIWLDLGIPDSSILQLPGKNTTAEIKSLSENRQLWEGKRCGIATSAFHLPRAMRLAKKFGVEAVPVGCDFRSNTVPMTVQEFLPDAGELSRLQFVLKEHLAYLLGR